MASTTDEILTIAEIKSELRIPAGTISQDDMLLRRQIRGRYCFRGAAAITHPC